MGEPTASVIICVYNHGRQAQDCLHSLLAMERQDFEIVLVDDASTDDTPDRLAAFREAHPDRAITIVRNQRNLGVSGARNVGLRAAQGRYAFFTDSDCIVSRRWLGTMIAALEESSADAVAGLVRNPPPTTLAERAYVGGSRLHAGRFQDRQLVGGSMGFVRRVALQYLFDEALTYGCDEDDMARRLRADGRTIAFAADAELQHNHRLTMRSYLRMAYRQGMGSARYWYKHGVYVGRDLWAGLAGVATLPLGLIDWRLLAVPLFLLLLQLAASAYNEIALKGKGVVETLCVLPVCVLCQVCKTCGVVRTWLRMLFGGEHAIRESKRRWRDSRRSA
jgi:GT2 family glycosyltransferase